MLVGILFCSTIISLSIGQSRENVTSIKENTSIIINNKDMQQVNFALGMVSASINPIETDVLNTTTRNDGATHNDNGLVSSTLTDTAQMRRNLAYLLTTFCPGVDICTEEKSNNDLKQIVSTDDASCCTACSCSASCHKSKNCCFPTAEDDKGTEEAGCYSSLYPQRQIGELFGYPSYMMVDSVTLDKNASSKVECRNTNVAPWGSLYPVYSNSRSKIYKNSVCAAADGLNDTFQFKATVACNLIDFVTRGALFTGTIWEDFHEHCDVWFTLPKEFQVVLQEYECYNNLVSTCPDQFNNYSLIPRDQLIAACNSGLKSPFRVYGFDEMIVYKNVFCSICNGDYNQITCPYREIRTLRNFVTLLEDVGFDGFADNSKAKKTSQACLFINGSKVEDTCRPVMCPNGQIYSTDGVCKFIVNTWYNYKVLVYLQLKADSSFETNNLNMASFTFKSARHWTIQTIYYFPSNISQPNVTDSIMILIVRKFKLVNPKVALDIARRLKDSVWNVKTPNGNVSMRADFMDSHDRYSYVVHVDTIRLLRNIYFSDSRIDDGIVIDQMAYCKQVTMRPEEISLREKYRGVFMFDFIFYNNITDRLLIPGDFFFPNMPDLTRIRVCIENSGLLEDVNGDQALSVTAYVLVLLVILSLVF